MTLPAPLAHPGPRAAARLDALPCRAAPLKVTLAAGLPFDVAVSRALADAGFAAGYLRLSQAEFETLSYVIPAPAPGDGRAAWYSATHVLTRAVAAEAGLHLGRKAGQPFLHCHGLWARGGEPLRMGHLLSPESRLARDTVATGWGISGAAFEVSPDPETGFDLFAPVASGAPGTAGRPARLCRLRPNEDPHALLDREAAEMGPVRIEGIGSLVSPRFDGAAEESYATEVLVTEAGHAAGATRIEVASVGFDGTPVSGRLRPHANRVCITAELLLIG